MTSESIAANARIALEHLNDQIIGLTEQERQIENIVCDFLRSKDGKCCLLEGKRNSGRESVLRKVLHKYHKNLRVIKAGFVAADPTYQHNLAKEENDGYSVFLVRDADKLLSPQQQKFLYTMVDKATDHSWLVFFSVSRQDFAQNLQKQATSRIPKVQVSFKSTFNYEEYCSAMTQLLIPPGSACEEDDPYKEFISNLEYKKWLKPFFELKPFVTLKQIAAQLLMLFGYYFNDETIWNTDEIQREIKIIIDRANPSFSGEILLLNDQTLRAQCVFLCVWRLLQNKSSDGPLITPRITYRTVFLEFKKLVHTVYTSLDVISDIYVFRELDHLVKMGLLRADESANVTNTSFRKVWLSINDKIVKDSIQKLQLPSVVCDFFETVLK
uniref:ORC4_C domain-containing protein n=1 Tax=Caenorhabditis tropicalis TaxID=1561998 RepID=A0A1I7TMA6_9PELO